MRSDSMPFPIQAVATLWVALVELGRNWRPLLLALIIPVAGSAAVVRLNMVFGASQTLQWLLLAPMLFFYVLFGMSCHRIILSGADSLPNRLGIYWTPRETRFAIWVVVIGVITAIIWTPFSFVTLYFPPGSEYRVLLDAYWYSSMFVVTALEGRISLVLPATAIGKSMDFRDSWRMTRGHALALGVALFVPVLLDSLAMRFVASLLPPRSYFAAAMIRELVLFPLIALGVAVLSVMYKFASHTDAD